MRRRIRFISLFFVCLLILTACVASVKNASIDYGVSGVYPQADLEKAVSVIQREFLTWKGCTLHSIRYAGDSYSNAENLQWLNGLGSGSGSYMQCILFLSDFHSPKNSVNAFNSDFEYTDWQWWHMAVQRAVILPRPMRVLVAEMDSYAFLRPMAKLFECRCGQGRLLVSSLGLHQLGRYSEARALQRAIYHYLGSDEFEPKQELSMNWVESILKSNSDLAE